MDAKGPRRMEDSSERTNGVNYIGAGIRKYKDPRRVCYKTKVAKATDLINQPSGDWLYGIYIAACHD